VTPDAPAICILASSSGGNCSVLLAPRQHAPPDVWLIDLGLSPRRTRNLLAGVGIDLSQLRGILLTHLDADHAHPGWIKALPPTVPLHMHRRHLRRAEREGWLQHRTLPFELDIQLRDDVTAHTRLVAHDAHGAVAFRFTLTCRGAGEASLGFLTDVGTVEDATATFLRGVQVLAIESNYCPHLQTQSDRPEFLKQRIMGGKGHLSNQQCADAVRRIAPRRDVVLLHLSRQCNTPDLAQACHEGAPYRLRVASHDTPTEWISLPTADVPASLFS
jgi:phosphoribosyl 1,2-cyclic phosphodiesterase